MDLSDKQWNILAPLIPNRRRSDGKGRPRRDPREVLSGILWIQGRIRWMRTGAQWADLPERYPPYQTRHRRFQEWIEEEILQSILEALAQDLERRGKIDLGECYRVLYRCDLRQHQKGGPCVGRTKRGEGSKIMAQLLQVLASPSTLKLLARMKSSL